MRLREEEENLRSFVDEVIATTSQESGVTRDEPAMPPPSKQCPWRPPYFVSFSFDAFFKDQICFLAGDLVRLDFKNCHFKVLQLTSRQCKSHLNQIFFSNCCLLDSAKCGLSIQQCQKNSERRPSYPFCSFLLETFVANYPNCQRAALAASAVAESFSNRIFEGFFGTKFRKKMSHESLEQNFFPFALPNSLFILSVIPNHNLSLSLTSWLQLD